jgi:arginase family enzyme
MGKWAVLGVPIDSVGRSGGTELAPAALREAGLVERLGVADRGDLDVRIRGDERDPETGIVGSPDVLATTTAVRAAVVRWLPQASARWSSAAAARSSQGRSRA